jgi:hypothetical protein
MMDDPFLFFWTSTEHAITDSAFDGYIPADGKGAAVGSCAKDENTEYVRAVCAY